MRIQSADDVLQIPLPPGVSGYELVDGELVEVVPVGPLHGEVAAKLCKLLGHYLEEHPEAGRVYVEAGFVLALRRDAERLRGPDVSFVGKDNLERHGGVPTRGFFRLAPDLAIEIESAERPKSQQQRTHDYLDAGTRIVWIIHSLTKSATVYRSDGSARLVRDS